MFECPTGSARYLLISDIYIHLNIFVPQQSIVTNDIKYIGSKAKVQNKYLF